MDEDGGWFGGVKGSVGSLLNVWCKCCVCACDSGVCWWPGSEHLPRLPVVVLMLHLCQPAKACLPASCLPAGPRGRTPHRCCGGCHHSCAAGAHAGMSCLSSVLFWRACVSKPVGWVGVSSSCSGGACTCINCALMFWSCFVCGYLLFVFGFYRLTVVRLRVFYCAANRVI